MKNSANAPDDGDHTPHFTEVFLCAILSWQVVAFAAVRVAEADAIWMCILVAFPPMAIYLSVRAMAEASAWSRKKRLAAATVLALFTAPALILLHGLWDASAEQRFLITCAVCAAIGVAMFLRKWPLPSQHPRHAWMSLAAGMAIVCSVLGAVLGVIAWKTRSIRAHAMQRWERIGRPWAAFEQRLAAHQENDSLRQLGEDARPYGFGPKTPRVRGVPAIAEKRLVTSEDSAKSYAMARVVHLTNGDRLSFKSEDISWFDAHSAGLSDIYRRILDRPLPAWTYDLNGAYGAGEWYSTDSRIEGFCNLILCDSAFRMARADIAGAQLAVKAARQLARGFENRPGSYSLNLATALEIFISCIEARLPQGNDVEMPSISWPTRFADSLQFISLRDLKALDEGGMAGSDSIFSWSAGFNLEVRLPYWLAAFRHSRELALKLDAADAERVQAIESISQSGDVSYAFPSEMGYVYTTYVQLAMLSREQAGILRQLRKGGSAPGGQFPSAVIAGSTWIAKPVAGVPDAVDLSLAPALPRVPAGVEGWTAFPFFGGRWQFAPTPQVSP